MDNHPGRVADYTTANLVLAFANLFWVFWLLWALWGLGAVLLAGAGVNHAITRLGVYRRRAAIAATARGKASPPSPELHG